MEWTVGIKKVAVKYTFCNSNNFHCDFSVPKDDDKIMASGFFLPRAKCGDFPYFVRRANSWLYAG